MPAFSPRSSFITRLGASRPTVRRSVLAVVAGAAVTVAVTMGAIPAAAQSSGSSSGSGSGSMGSSEIHLPIPTQAGLHALAAAATQTGKPYLWGGVGPHAWDCSGLVQWAFAQAGVRLPRTTWEQAEVGTRVPFSALAPGDVVVLHADASHIGIYAGFGMVFNAHSPGVPTGLTPLSDFVIYDIRRFY